MNSTDEKFEKYIAKYNLVPIDFSLHRLTWDAALASSQPRSSEIETVVRIMCEAQGGAALNAVVEDYPELWEHISKLKATLRAEGAKQP